MPTRVEPKAFISFSVRLDLATNERRRRLEKVLGLSAPRLLERIFSDFENHLLTQLSDTHRKAYLAGELTVRTEEVPSRNDAVASLRDGTSSVRADRSH